MFRIKHIKTVLMISLMSVLLGQLKVVSADNTTGFQLEDWSQKVKARVNEKMERKLDQIVMQAQIMQNLEQGSKRLSGHSERDIGCEQKKISQI